MTVRCTVLTPRGGATATVLSTLTSICRCHHINPHVYRTRLLARVLGTPISELDTWLPDPWKITQAAAT